MLEFIALGYAMVKIDFNHVSGILRSMAWVVFHPLTIINKRKRFRMIRKLKDRDVLKKICKTPVVLAHFLAGKKTYLDIVSKAD